MSDDKDEDEWISCVDYDICGHDIDLIPKSCFHKMSDGNWVCCDCLEVVNGDNYPLAYE